MFLFNEIKTKLIVVLMTTFVLIAALLFLYSIHLYDQTIDDYQSFFKLWQSQEHNSYLLNYSSSGCKYTIKVTKGIPITVDSASNDRACEFIPPWLNTNKPMTSLFMDLIQSSYPHCGANGCICDNINYSIIKFDKKLGYIQSWKEINSGGFTPYSTAWLLLSKACRLMYTVPLDFAVDIRLIQ